MSSVACIDIGTVTARLAVADVEGGHVVRLAKRSQICNLGQDVDKTHRLRQDAMERVFGCVAAYVEEARRAGATSACCTLTSAARAAQPARESLRGRVRPPLARFCPRGSLPARSLRP